MQLRRRVAYNGAMSIDTRAQVQESLRARDAERLERNKQVARQVIERIFMRQEDSAIDELVSESFVAHTFGPMAPGRDGLREGMRRAGAGVSDARFEIHDMIAEDDRVAARLTTSARHTGRFMGIEPSGNRYTIDEIHIFRIRDGQLIEHWHAFDRAALMGQLKGDTEG
jgi:predicted ester cyclase